VVWVGGGGGGEGEVPLLQNCGFDLAKLFALGNVAVPSIVKANRSIPLVNTLRLKLSRVFCV
jgi:hypothetical protein